MTEAESIALLAQTVSEFAGRLSAFDATMRGVLSVISGDPRIAEAVGVELEKEYTQHLQTSVNSVFLQEFESQADVIRAKVLPSTIG